MILSYFWAQIFKKNIFSYVRKNNDVEDQAG